jgi:hypothetical protein
MHRWSAAPFALSGLLCAAVLGTLAPASPAAGASGISVKVTPDKGLVDGQAVTITGRGLARSSDGKPLTWFVAECTAAVQGRMNPSTDTPHCDITGAQAIRVRANRTFTARFRVLTGIVGDGYCATPGHASCVIGVGNALGQGTVVRITFKAPPSTATAPTTTSTT